MPMTVKLACEKCSYDRAYLCLDLSNPDALEIPTYTVCVSCKHRGPNHTEFAPEAKAKV